MRDGGTSRMLLVGLRICYARQDVCGSEFADLVLDVTVEQSPVGPRVEIQDGRRPNEVGSSRVPFELVNAFAHGLRATAAHERRLRDRSLVVTVRSVGWDEVDSGPRAFRAAGRLAIRRVVSALRSDDPQAQNRLGQRR